MNISDKQKFTEIIFDNIRDGIVMLDRDYRILAANNSVGKWIQKDTTEIIEKDCREVFHEKSWVCPHCAAKVSFETGEVNIVTQKVTIDQDTFYAELSAYPILDDKGQVFECAVFIQDITDRMLCHDEVLRLFNEVTNTKEYIESIIENSADAIITSDINGIIISWNRGAEEVYGFEKSDVLGKFLPHVLDSQTDPEREYNQRIRNGEVIKRIETSRKKKDGSIVSVSLTLSPIKNPRGEVIGISSISRDISEKKNVEKELIRRNQELSRLFFISSAMRGTLELERLLRMVLAAVTMGDGLGFNRAILFLVDEEKNLLKGALGVGPDSHEEAFHIWDRLSLERKTLHDVMHEIENGPSRQESYFDKISKEIEISLARETAMTKAVKEKRPFNIYDSGKDMLSDSVITEKLGTHAYAIVPLISRDKVIGVLWVDNYFTRKPITEEDMRFLTAFSNHVSSAIENARLFEQIRLTEQELENIFESISDMVYFVSQDYTVKKINQAVSRKLGKKPHEIVGKKCYEIFHGMDTPWHECPHQKTVETRKAHVKEVENDFLGGTFIVSSSPIFDSNGESIGTVNVVSDVTELKNLRERVIMTSRMAALGEVAARVAHEIRNPLVSLGGFARRLEKKLDGHMKEYADIISKEVERLEEILNDILSFVKETRIKKEVVDSNLLFGEVLSLVGSDIEDKHIVLQREFGEPVTLFIDPNRMKDALLNILKNAVQAVAINGVLSIKAYARDRSCIFEIKDNGSGIAEQDLPFIFDPFFTTKKGGTGLGLTITHNIIEEHHGNIEVESKPGEGTIFRVILPIKKDEEQEKGGI